MMVPEVTPEGVLRISVPPGRPAGPWRCAPCAAFDIGLSGAVVGGRAEVVYVARWVPAAC